MNLKLVGCDKLARELYFAASISPHKVEIMLMPCGSKGEEIQKRLGEISQADYVLLAFGACSIEGICPENIPLIAARAHNCAQLLLGSKEKLHRAYQENDDQPNWINLKQCEICSSRFGTKCVVQGPFQRIESSEIPVGTREYAEDISLVSKLLNGGWNEEEFILVQKGCRIVSDPVTILEAEVV